MIDEPIGGHFYWLILGREVFGQPRTVIDHSHGPYPTYQRATDAGVAAMLRHSEPVVRQRAALSPAVSEKYETGPGSPP